MVSTMTFWALLWDCPKLMKKCMLCCYHLLNMKAKIFQFLKTNQSNKVLLKCKYEVFYAIIDQFFALTFTNKASTNIIWILKGATKLHFPSIASILQSKELNIYFASYSVPAGIHNKKPEIKEKSDNKFSSTRISI